MLGIYPFKKAIKEQILFGDLQRTGKSLQLNAPVETQLQMRNSCCSN